MSFEDLKEPTIWELRTPDELYDLMNEKMLRSAVSEEDRRIEKKPNSFTLRDLGDYLCMWANTPPHGGLIVLGIRRDHTFEGMTSMGTAHINRIEKSGMDYCPDARYATKRIAIRRDKDNVQDFVLLVRVFYNRNRVVRTSNGKVYCRVGDSKKTLHEQEIRQLAIDKGEANFELEPSRLQYPNDYEFIAIDTFTASVREDKDWSKEHTKEEILELMHLGQIASNEFVPNSACDLLFAKDPQLTVAGCKIRFLRFEGELEGTGEKWNAVKDEMITGPLPKQITRAADILRSQLREFSRLGPNGKFFTSPEYPEPAWYEAVVNACAHRAYSNGLGNMSIFIKMFDDRLVIESPGPFPPFVTPQNIYDVTIPRNPFLMESLRHLKFVKAAHEGTRRMRTTMQQMELPEPEFEQGEVGGAIVRVTLRNNIKQRKVWVDADVASVLGVQIAQSLTESQKRWLNFMAEHGELSVSDAARLSGGSWEATKKGLMRLVEMGIAHHEHRSDMERDPKARFRLVRPT